MSQEKNMIKKLGEIKFPHYQGLRCLMMPYIQGDAESVPEKYHSYKNILNDIFIKKGDVGFLTIDESFVTKGKPQRGERAKCTRALHTEAGLHPTAYGWGGCWGWKNKCNT